jgi:transposase
MGDAASVDPDVVVGVDVGKRHHYGCAVDRDGAVVWEGRLGNDEPELADLLSRLSADGSALVVVDQLAAIGALIVKVASGCGVAVGYLPGLSMRRLADLHPGSAKTDRRDAHVIADAGRSMRHVVQLVDPDDDELAADIAVLAGYDEDLRGQVNRESNRLHDALTHVHPALERALSGHLQRAGVLALLAEAPGPAALRALGADRISQAMKDGGSPRLAMTLPSRIMTALEEQTVTIPGTAAFSRVIAGTAARLRQLLVERDRLEAELAALLEAHPFGEVLLSMPSVGTRTAAGIIAHAPDPAAFRSADAFVSYCGLSPVTRQSGTSIRGERPNRGGNRALRNVMWRSADIARLTHPASRDFYQRKRAAGKTHAAAMLALARRRARVIHALMKHRTRYAEPSPQLPAAA